MSDSSNSQDTIQSTDTNLDRLKLAKELYERGDLVNSSLHYRQLIEKSEMREEALYGLGLVELASKNLGNAEKLFLLAVQLNPRLFNAWHYLGVISRTNGNLEQAQSYYEKALSEKPDHRNALEDLDIIKKKRSTALPNFSEEPNDFYSRLVNNQSPTAQRMVTLIKSLECSIQPSVGAFLGLIILTVAISAFGTFVLSFIFLIILLGALAIAPTGFIFPISFLLVLLVAIFVFFTCTARIKKMRTAFKEGIWRIDTFSPPFTIQNQTVYLNQIQQVEVRHGAAPGVRGHPVLVLICRGLPPVGRPYEVLIYGLGSGKDVSHTADIVRELLLLNSKLTWEGTKQT